MSRFLLLTAAHAVCRDCTRPPMLLQLKQHRQAQQCQTALVTDRCYQEILADRHYLVEPGAYAPLPANASLEELQDFYYSRGVSLDSTFEPIDGGVDRVCRGRTVNDNHPSNYLVVKPTDLDHCERECRASYGCLAIEYSLNRCELWFSHVGATKPLAGFQCRRLVQHGTAWVFEAVDGADGRVCRHTSPTDNSASYFSVDWAQNVSQCMTKCLETPMCAGVEFHEKGRCELWNTSIGASLALKGYQCMRLVEKPDNRHCLFPACRCHTAVVGEPCYDDVVWAMTNGIFAEPSWYPGLTSSSSFEDFQMLLYTNGNARCNDPPCAATTTTTSSGTLSGCEAVWEAEASDPWSTSTCGGRIEYYKREGMSSQEAKAKVGLYYSSCEACWPWAKYKALGDTRISRKRGVAQQNWRLTGESLSTLAQSLSWGYTWNHRPDDYLGGPDLSEWERHGLSFLPMVWGGGDRLSRAERDQLPKRRALLGFNEPNFPEQANLLPAEAASLWPVVEELARNASIDYIVSPAVNFAAYDPFEWLEQFFGNCTGCKVDAVAFHSYTCYGRYLQDHIERYKVFKLPLWLTEFACSEAGSEERLPAEGQMAFMREAIPLLEREPLIEMYAWFSMFEDDWLYPIVDGKNGDAGLVYSNGSLTPLGSLYSSFTGPDLVAPPERVAATTTPPPCRTALAGEACHEAVRWAMTEGVVSNPEWYGGLTLENSFEDFQSFFFQESTLNGVCAAPACEGCRTAVRGEACYDDVLWAMATGIPSNPERYPGLSTQSSFEEVQEWLWREDVNDRCGKPCVPNCVALGACVAQGVNVFGYDGFQDDAAIDLAVRDLFAKGVRHFRVVNVGAWADVALGAIDRAAEAYGGDSSVQITSLFFDSPSRCPSLPSWMDFSMPTTLQRLKDLKHVSRILVQLDTCSICQDAELYCINPTEQGFGQTMAKAETFRRFIQEQYGPLIRQAHENLPSSVEFVIPFQNERASPRELLDPLLSQYVQPLRAQGRKFHLEGTLYPFWTSTTAAYASFDTAAVQSSLALSRELSLDGFVVAETGWPQGCPLNENRRPASLRNMCRYWDDTLREVQLLAQQHGSSLLVYHWKFGAADDGSCGESTWGLYDRLGSFVCDR